MKGEVRKVVMAVVLAVVAEVEVVRKGVAIVVLPLNK